MAREYVLEMAFNRMVHVVPEVELHHLDLPASQGEIDPVKVVGIAKDNRWYRGLSVDGPRSDSTQGFIRMENVH